MKTYKIIAACAIFASCTINNDKANSLSRADKLMEEQPDSALAILENIDSTQLTTDKEKAMYVLLLTQAEYKNYKQPTVDNRLDFAIDYFKKKNISHDVARGYYYKGMTLFEKGKRIEAAEYLKRGEEIVVKTNDTLQLSKYYESLYQINLHSKNYDMAMDYAKKFLDNSMLRKDNDCIARGLSHISTIYVMEGNRDSAEVYIKQSLIAANGIDSLSKAHILTNVGCIMRTKGDYQEAKKYIKMAINIKPLDNAYVELGNIYAAEGKEEEAAEIWEKVIDTGCARMKVSATYSLVNLLLKKEQYRDAFVMFYNIIQVEDSLNKDAETLAIAEVQHKYDRKVAENRSQALTIYILLIIIVALILIMTLIYYHKRKVKTFESVIEENYNKIMEAETEIDRLERAGEENSKEIGIMKRKIDDLRSSILTRLGKGHSVFETIANGGRMPVDDKTAELCLIEYYSVFNHKKYEEWIQDYKKLTPRLLAYLILSDMGKSDDEISTILAISDSSVRSIKSRIKSQKRGASTK